MKVKKTLAELRRDKRYTQREVSEKTGIPFSSITAYELGYRTVPLDRALKLAEFYGVKVTDIKFLGTKIEERE